MALPFISHALIDVTRFSPANGVRRHSLHYNKLMNASPLSYVVVVTTAVEYSVSCLSLRVLFRTPSDRTLYPQRTSSALRVRFYQQNWSCQVT